MEQTQFKVGSLDLRPKMMSATEMLGLESVIETGDADKAQRMYETILEKIEVEIAGVWVPLKEKGVDVYHPANLAEEPATLYKIATAFLTKVLFPVFRKSEESNK